MSGAHVHTDMVPKICWLIHDWDAAAAAAGGGAGRQHPFAVGDLVQGRSRARPAGSRHHAPHPV